MAERGISLTELAAKVGITMANLSILKTNKGRAIRFSTLEAICRELDCQPGDLLEFVNGNQTASTQQVTHLKPLAPKDHRSDSGLPGDYY